MAPPTLVRCGVVTTDPARAASRELARAARAALTDLGLRTSGRGARSWRLDRGWWVLHVELQPTRTAGSTLLNVGPQLLWDRFPTRNFGLGGRVPGHADLLHPRATPEQVAREADALAAAAREAVVTWLDRAPDDRALVRWVASAPAVVGVARRFQLRHRALAHAALGHADDARAACAAILADPAAQGPEDRRWCERLAELADRPDLFWAEVDGAVADMRRLLGLPALDGAPVLAALRRART